MNFRPIFEDIEDWEKLPLHSLCTLFPEADELDYDNLVESMKTHGFLESDPIVLIEVDDSDPDGGWAVLDGRNRLIAAGDARVEPTFAHYVGENPVAFVTSKNLDRRHLTTGQKAAVAADLAALEAGQNSNGDSMTQSEAADKVGVGEATVRRYKFVEKHSPELAAKVKSGEVPLEKARSTIKKGLAGEVEPVTTESALADVIPPTLGDKKAARKAKERDELMDKVNNIVKVALRESNLTEIESESVKSALITCVTRGYALGKADAKRK